MSENKPVNKIMNETTEQKAKDFYLFCSIMLQCQLNRVKFKSEGQLYYHIIAI